MLRKLGCVFAVVAMLAAQASQSKAADLPIRLPIPGGSSTSSVVRIGAGGASLGAFVTFAIIGVMAGICAYDIYLKIEGVKNWDGTPKVAHPHKHQRTV